MKNKFSACHFLTPKVRFEIFVAVKHIPELLRHLPCDNFSHKGKVSAGFKVRRLLFRFFRKKYILINPSVQAFTSVNLPENPPTLNRSWPGDLLRE